MSKTFSGQHSFILPVTLDIRIYSFLPNGAIIFLIYFHSIGNLDILLQVTGQNL